MNKVWEKWVAEVELVLYLVKFNIKKKHVGMDVKGVGVKFDVAQVKLVDYKKLEIYVCIDKLGINKKKRYTATFSIIRNESNM
jgi:hypothetical protein